MRKIKVLCLITTISFLSFFNISSAKSETLKGKNVVIKGFVINVGTLGFIYEELGSLTFISVETKNADRNTRKYLLKECASGCNIKLKGTLSEVYDMITMNLESIIK